MKVKINTKFLDQFEKMLDNIPKAKIGILASSNSREESNSNATIGFKHEFGIGVPKRSFIREPLIQNMMKNLEEAGFNEDTLEEAIKAGGFKQVVQKIGIVGVSTIQDAFNTGFEGKWAPHADGYSNNTGMILVDTQQLRNSIISEVE